jgi:predicted alpha/beta-fold hydrolase
MTGTSKLLNEHNVDAVCVNFRGCSGEDNTLFRSYHSGDTQDLHEVIMHVLETRSYGSIYIKGFSLGGNVALKYLGEQRDIPKEVKAGMAISVPCYLHGSCLELHKFNNVLYHDRFRKHLVDKLKIKQKIFPDLISSQEIKSIKTLLDFDNVYTSKAHGFKDALEYYEKSSSLQFLKTIKVPTLIINALNDSFLSPECFPIREAKNNEHLFLEMPKHGGHVGFHDSGNLYYNEKRTLEFVREL